jgi:TPR repeat protein
MAARRRAGGVVDLGVDEEQLVPYAQKANSILQRRPGIAHAGVDTHRLKTLASGTKSRRAGFLAANEFHAMEYRHEDDFMSLLTRADREGDREAMFTLGRLYRAGDLLPRDEIEAVKWFRRAAEQGHDDACVQVGLSYLSGLGVEKSSEDAIEWFERAAARGSQVAQAKLGSMLNLHNKEKTLSWLRRAASNGFPNAQCQLGKLLLDGKVLPRDGAEARRLFLSCAERSMELPDDAEEQRYIVDAVYHLGLCADDFSHEEYVPVRAVAEESAADALKWYLEAACKGHDLSEASCAAICSVAEAFLDGEVVVCNRELAARLFLRAAQRGWVAAMFAIGYLFCRGCGVAQDYSQAFEWFLKAAERGDAAAQHHLALCYLQGHGVATCMRTAVEWLERSAASGYADAQFNLGLCYVLGKGVRRETGMAFRLFRLAAEQGHRAAAINLVSCAKLDAHHGLKK